MSYVLKILAGFLTTLLLFTGCQSDSTDASSTIVFDDVSIELDNYTKTEIISVL